MKLGMGLVIKNKIIPLIPETPGANQEDLHERKLGLVRS
jgi:hypothetical protein